MWNEKQKNDVQRLVEGVLKIEYPEDKYADPRSLEVRPILPMDFELEDWVWKTDKVKLCPLQHIVLYGIHSRYLLEVKFRSRGPSGNIFAAVSTGQTLYEPYFWKKKEERWLTWRPLEKISSKQLKSIPFSITGFVIERIGMYIAP